jgi:hypothetical protein
LRSGRRDRGEHVGRRAACADFAANGYWGHSRGRPKLEGKGSTRCKGASSGYQVSRWRGERRDDGRPVDMLSQGGLGIVTLACLSGRPIVPTAIASSHYRSLHTPNRYTINFPYSRLALVVGKPMFIPRDDETEGLEHCRKRVENAMTYKAHAAARANAPVSPRPDQWLKPFQTFSELLGDSLCVQHGSRQM